MAFIPTPNGISVEVRCTLAGQQVENCFHVRTDEGTPSSKLVSVATIVRNWVLTDWFDNISEDVEFREVYVTDISSDSGGTFSASNETPVFGAITEPSVANNVAYCLSLLTAKRGRSYRGRWYAYGFTRLAVNDSAIPSTLAAAFRSSLLALRVLLDDNSTPFCVLSKRNNKVNRTEGVLTPINGVKLVDLVVDSQRRRLPGRGI